MDQRDLRQIFSAFATGVTVVTTYDSDGAPVAITANSFTSVSLEPPLLLWCLDNRSRQLGAFSKGAAFAVHILGEGQAETALRFARSGATGLASWNKDKPGRSPQVDGVLARIECGVSDLHVAGDHTIIIGEIQSAEITDAAPLVFQKSRFGQFTPADLLSGREAWHILVDMWS